MNEYVFNDKKYIDDYAVAGQNVTSIFKDNPYMSDINVDNYPSHRIVEADGEVREYCAASKHFAKVDPECRDVKSIQMAPEYRVYLVMKNKHSGQWEFPTTTMTYGHTFTYSKNQLFKNLTNGNWKIKFEGKEPKL